MGFEEKLLQFGLAGVIMGGVMYIVVRPLLNGMMEQLKAAREDRVAQCVRHAEFHEKTAAILERLAISVESLVNRVNGTH